MYISQDFVGGTESLENSLLTSSLFFLVYQIGQLSVAAGKKNTDRIGLLSMPIIY